MKFYALLLISGAVIASTSGCGAKTPAFTSATVSFDTPQTTIFTVDIADSVDEQTLGLGDVDVLPANHGMLFVYSQADVYTFWMRNVEYPIDIIWLRDGTVVDITANVPPESPTTALSEYRVYSPKQPVNMVLEVGSGVAEEAGITIGQHLTIDP